MDGLTDRQRRVFDFMACFEEQHGMAPTIREIMEAMGLRSTNGVQDHLRAPSTGALVPPEYAREMIALLNGEGPHLRESQEHVDARRPIGGWVSIAPSTGECAYCNKPCCGGLLADPNDSGSLVPMHMACSAQHDVDEARKTMEHNLREDRADRRAEIAFYLALGDDGTEG